MDAVEVSAHVIVQPRKLLGHVDLGQGVSLVVDVDQRSVALLQHGLELADLLGHDDFVKRLRELGIVIGHDETGHGEPSVVWFNQCRIDVVFGNP